MIDHAKYRPTTVDLKPCPFCGGEAEISWTQTSTPHPYARCKFGTSLEPKCAGATFFTYRYNTEEEAAAAWNRRVPNERDARKPATQEKTTQDMTPIDSTYVELWLKDEIRAAEEREINAADMMVAMAAGAQKAPLQRVLEKVKRWKGKTGLYEV